MRTTVKKGKIFELLFFVQENIDEVEERKKLSETIKFSKSLDKWFENKRLFLLLGFSLAFLINSFFYLSITCLLTLILFLILEFKKKVFYFINLNKYGFIILSFLILFGLSTIFLQTTFFRMKLKSEKLH